MQQGYSFYRGKGEFHCDKTTWHAHFYSKPPARPTPHFVEDILGLKSRGRDQDKRDTIEDIIVDEQITDSRGDVFVDVSCIRKSKLKNKSKSRIKCSNAIEDKGMWS